jgi:hypothetical protein
VGNRKGKGGELADLAGDTLQEVIGAAQRGIDRVRRTPICRIRFFVLRTRPVAATVTPYGKTLLW